MKSLFAFFGKKNDSYRKEKIKRFYEIISFSAKSLYSVQCYLLLIFKRSKAVTLLFDSEVLLFNLVKKVSVIGKKSGHPIRERYFLFSQSP